MDLKEAFDYELRSHWLASWISFDWGQELMTNYLVWKVKKKYARYKLSKEMEQKIKKFK